MSFIDTVLNSVSSGVSGAVGSAVDTALGSYGNSANIKKNNFGLKPEYTLTIKCTELGIEFKAPLPPEIDWASSAEYDSPMKDVIGGVIESTGKVGTAVKTLSRASGIQLVTQALTAKFWSGSATASITIPVVLQAYSDEVEDVLKPLVQLKALTLPRTQGNSKGSLLEAPGPHFDIAKAYDAAKSSSSSWGSSIQKSVAGITTSVSSTSSSSGFLDSLGKLSSSAISSAQQSAYGALKEADSFFAAATRNTITVQIGNYIRFPSVVIKDVQDRHLIQPVGSSTLGKSTGNMQRVEVSIQFEPFTDLVLADLKDIFLDPRVAKEVERILSKASGKSAGN